MGRPKIHGESAHPLYYRYTHAVSRAKKRGDTELVAELQSALQAAGGSRIAVNVPGIKARLGRPRVPVSDPKWQGPDGKFSSRRYQAWRCKNDPDYILTKIYDMALYRARRDGDSELLAGLQAGLASAGGKKCRVNVDGIKRRLRVLRYKPRPEPLASRVSRKLQAAKLAGTPAEQLMDKDELRWLRNDRKRNADYRNLPGRRAITRRQVRRYAATLKAEHPDRYRRMRQFDNALQSAERNGDARLAEALRIARLQAGKSWLVDIREVYHSVGKQPTSRMR